MPKKEKAKAKLNPDDELTFKISQKLTNHLHTFGIGPKTAERVIKFFGPLDVLPTIKENPYSLMLVPGISFRRADNIAQNTGVLKTDPRRHRALVMHILEEATFQGHAYLPAQEMEKRARREKIDVIGDETIIGDLVTEKILVVEGTWPVSTAGLETRVYLKKYFDAENAVAEHLRRRSRTVTKALGSSFFDIKDRPVASIRLQWDRDQRDFLANFDKSNLVVLTGGPGTGKTAVTAAVCERLIHNGAPFALCAPTGKAAKRCSELTGQKAFTVHRFLKGIPALERWGYNRYNQKLGLRYVIVDESSMLDIRLAYRILEALPDSTQLIFIGDVDQLRPVGPGSFFKDLIRSEIVPVFRLKTNHRQGKGSLIADNALAINKGSLKFSYDNRDFFYIEAENAPVVREKLVHIIDILRDKLGYTDFVHDIQVLTPQKKTSIGTMKLNEMLRFLVNLKADPTEPYSVGDKVMQVTNDYTLKIFNGFTGRILEVSQSNYLIDFFDSGGSNEEGAIIYPKRKARLNLMHAYACTVHKYQGSEIKVGIIIISSTHNWMLTRNLLYTGITRCKEICVLVGDKMGLRRAIRNNREQERYSQLLYKLQV